eukprot:GHRQ01036226.1.p1 GENE.GHRQ01036226.1~~GHRQ01036226.1.p1  ORF type:complete len:108 (-),score=14.38 GHRQ01036226.1:823-1146(-)
MIGVEEDEGSSSQVQVRGAQPASSYIAKVLELINTAVTQQAAGHTQQTNKQDGLRAQQGTRFNTANIGRHLRAFMLSSPLSTRSNDLKKSRPKRGSITLACKAVDPE